MNKTFDLEAALAGKPVVNGNGTKVFITQLNRPTKCGYILISQDEHGKIQAYHFIDGNADMGSGLFRLYMAPTTVTKWVNIYKNTGTYKVAVHDSESEANGWATINRVGGKSLPITFEE